MQTREERLLQKRECEKRRRLKYPEKVKAERRATYLKNKEKCIARSKKYKAIYRADGRSKIYWRNEYENNKEKIKARQKALYKDKEFVKKRNAHLKKKRQTDLNFYNSGLILCRIKNAINKNICGPAPKTTLLLGCSIQEARAHLEKQFKPGMSWENRSSWHIDHIVPRAAFDLTDLEQQKKCFHYTNMQPLWPKENHEKSRQDRMLSCVAKNPD